jgi:hypothetical protein
MNVQAYAGSMAQGLYPGSMVQSGDHAGRFAPSGQAQASPGAGYTLLQHGSQGGQGFAYAGVNPARQQQQHKQQQQLHAGDGESYGSGHELTQTSQPYALMQRSANSDPATYTAAGQAYAE